MAQQARPEVSLVWIQLDVWLVLKRAKVSKQQLNCSRMRIWEKVSVCQLSFQNWGRKAVKNSDSGWKTNEVCDHD